MYFKALTIAALALTSGAVLAAPVPELEQYLEQQITTLDTAVNETPATVAAAGEGEQDAWFLRNFFLRVKPRVGISIPGLTTFQVIPEAELLWQRPLPEGWAVYKPR